MNVCLMHLTLYSVSDSVNSNTGDDLSKEESRIIIVKCGICDNFSMKLSSRVNRDCCCFTAVCTSTCAGSSIVCAGGIYKN